ncbi:MAG: apolipoprotein N-acyltransferase [Gammaproteobacteria bacterium]
MRPLFTSKAQATANWRGDLLAPLAGALLPLAFAPFGIFPLAVIIPALLIALWLNVSPRRAMWRGLLFGLGMFGTGVTWIYVSIYEFGGVSLPLSVFLMTLFVIVLAWFPALFGYFVTRVYPAPTPAAVRIKLLLIFPAGWTFFEWVRSWFLTGFPWLNLGYSQIDTPLAGLAPVLGVYGVSWATAFSAGLLLAVVLDKGGVWHRLRHIAVLLALWITAGLLGMQQWTQPTGTPLKVSLIQGNIPQDIKWTPDVRDPTLELYLRMTREHWDSNLIIWPETAMPVFYHEAEDFLGALGEEAREHHADMLIGVPVMDMRTQRYYNSMTSLGSHQAFYHKHHLVPFTEYLPMKSALAGVVDFLQVPMSDFSKGGLDQQPLSVAGQKAAISICYEAVFGEEVIRQLPAATLLVNVSNDAWFGHSIGPLQHLQITRMRALETGRPLLRATNTGITAIIGPNGKQLAVAPQFKTYALTATIQPMSGATPYVRVGNMPVVGMLVLALAMGLFLVKRR